MKLIDLSFQNGYSCVLGNCVNGNTILETECECSSKKLKIKVKLLYYRMSGWTQLLHYCIMSCTTNQQRMNQILLICSIKFRIMLSVSAPTTVISVGQHSPRDKTSVHWSQSWKSKGHLWKMLICFKRGLRSLSNWLLDPTTAPA